MTAPNPAIPEGEPRRRIGTDDAEIPVSSMEGETHKQTDLPPEVLPPANAENSSPRRGRPRLKLNGETVRQLASAQLSGKEIAAALGCSRATLEKRFSGQLADGRAAGIGSVKRELYRQAVDGILPAVLAFLRGYAGFNDRVLQLVPAPEEPEGSTTSTPVTEAIAQLNWIDRNLMRCAFEKVARITELNTHAVLQRVLTNGSEF